MTLWSYIRSTDISYLRNTDMIILQFNQTQKLVAFDELYQILISFKGGNDINIYVESAAEKEAIRDIISPVMDKNNIIAISCVKIE